MDSNKDNNNKLLPDGQRRAINSDAKIITVSAGAGTGKTWVLSNRYARLLLSSDDILPRDILTLTYTEAAASEMKRRIEDRVIKILEDDKNKNISTERKNAIIDGFGEAWISTIHSFAARIIRESGLALDIDPKAAVISGPQEENFWNGISQAAEFGNLKALARAYGNSKLIKLAKELDNDRNISYAVGRWGARTLSDLAKNTAELHASLGDNWEHFLQCAYEEFFIKNTRNILRGIMRNYRLDVFNTWGVIFDNLKDIITERAENGKSAANKLLYECMNYYYECRENIKNKNYENINDVDDDNEKKKYDFYLGNFYNKIVLDKDLRAHGHEPFTSIKSELNGMTLGDWRKQFPVINTETKFSDVEIKFYTSLLKFCALSWGLWDNMKRRRGLLSFSDMILHAQDAIKETESLKKFKYILVDEFQDTDPLQFKLIQATAGYSGKLDDAASENENLNTGLFAVGDLKQSIYGFRHAEPELFAKMINANVNSNIELDVSFRTRPELLEKINDLFAHIWEKGLGSSEAMRLVNFKKVNAAREKSGNVPPFSLIVFQNDADNGNLKTDDKRALLARELARKILYWVRNGFKIWDKGIDNLRPVKFSDFAILLRSRAPYEILEQVFNNEGVPSVQDLSKNYFSRGEVGDIINLLRASADKNDNASVAGWLMSPFSEVNRADAVNYIERSAMKNLNIYEILPSKIQKNLDYLARIGVREGAAELIAIFDRDRRWLENYKDDERLRVIRNLRSAMSLARSFQLQSGENASSLTACADWMIQAMRHGVNMEEPSWHDPEDNSVLFTTIHKSKGLEYPVTIIFDTSSSSGGKKNALRPSKELGVIFSSLPDELQDDLNVNCLAEWDKFLSERGEYEEDMRLFYVASTRAQDALIICGIADDSRSRWTNIALKRMIERGEDLHGENITFVKSDLAKNLDFSQDLNDLDDLNDLKDLNLNNKNKNNENSENLNIAHVQLPDKKFLSLNELSATAFAMYEWCPAAWRMRYRQGIDLKYAVNVPEIFKFAISANPANKNQPEIETYDKNIAENSKSGADVGSLAHWILSRSLSNASKFFTSLSRDDIPVYLRSVWDNEQSKSSVLEILKSFENSETYFMLSDAMSRSAKNNFGREAKFRIKLDKIILTGAMDIVWHDGGAWHVWDYKTTLSDNAPDELYKSQLDFYALVLREAAKLNNDMFSSVNAGLIYLREDGRIESWQVSGWDNLRKRIIDVAHNAVSGEFKINSARCPVCPFRNDCFVR